VLHVGLVERARLHVSILARLLTMFGGAIATVRPISAFGSVGSSMAFKATSGALGRQTPLSRICDDFAQSR
jgi:hypothetical protein